jgi:hypothetical protein
MVRFLFMIVILCLSAPAMAQLESPFLPTTPTVPRAFGAISSTPQCFNVVNTAPYTVYGSIHSNFFVRPDGIKTRHKSNFRLAPDDYNEFCTTGPFYDGNKVELVLRSLVPIFTCKTIATGNIIVQGRRLPEGGTETKALCIQ